MTPTADFFELTPSELDQSRYIIRVRNDPKFAAGVQTKKVNPNSSDGWVHYVGARGEVLVSRLTGASVDLRSWLGGDKGWDLEIAGLKIQVKTADYDKPPHLIFFKREDFIADVAVLCSVSQRAPESYVWVWGVISRQRFLRECYDHDFRHGMRVCVWADAMKPVKLLLDSIERRLDEAENY